MQGCIKLIVWVIHMTKNEWVIKYNKDVRKLRSRVRELEEIVMILTSKKTPKVEVMRHGDRD